MRLPHLPRRMTLPGALAISALIAAFFAVWSVYTISLLPPGIEARKLAIGDRRDACAAWTRRSR